MALSNIRAFISYVNITSVYCELNGVEQCDLMRLMALMLYQTEVVKRTFAQKFHPSLGLSTQFVVLNVLNVCAITLLLETRLSYSL